MPDRTPDGPAPEAGGATSAHGPAAAATDQGDRAQDRRAGRRNALAVVVPAVTFVVGLLLGAALMWAGTDPDDDGDLAAATPTQTTGAPETSATERPDATVTVPGSCLDLADSAEVAADLVQDAATAAQELDAAELSSIVRQLEGSRDELTARAGSCRSESGS